jgi:hypothetical protein
VARKMQVAIERKDSFDGYVVTCEDGRVFEAKTIAEAIELKDELQYSILNEISNQTGLTKEQIRLKAIEMFKGRENIIYERMEQLAKQNLIAQQKMDFAKTDMDVSKAKYDSAFGVAFVLLIIVFAINMLTKYLSHKLDVNK